MFAKKLDKADTNPEAARTALRFLFAEADSWANYTDDYEDTMQRYTYWLFGATLFSVLAAIFTLHFAVWVSSLLLLGLLFAGEAGSCVSVMAKMPALDFSLSGELDAYVMA